jgi:hypothetical protein
VAYDTGLMNPLSRLLWRLCEINGMPSRSSAASHNASTWPPIS